VASVLFFHEAELWAGAAIVKTKNTNLDWCPYLWSSDNEHQKLQWTQIHLDWNGWSLISMKKIYMKPNTFNHQVVDSGEKTGRRLKSIHLNSDCCMSQLMISELTRLLYKIAVFLTIRQWLGSTSNRLMKISNHLFGSISIFTNVIFFFQRC
jgi:hypothetical protein